MAYSDELLRATGKRWVQRNAAPIEFSPFGDPPPFPREMVSILPVPAPVDTMRAVQAMREMLLPLVWDGSIDSGLITQDSQCGWVQLANNPLTGPLFMGLRTFQSRSGGFVVGYEIRGKERPGEQAALLRTIAKLQPPAADDLTVASSAPSVSGQERPLAGLVDALASEQITSHLKAALSEVDILRQYISLALLSGQILRYTAFLDNLHPEAYSDMIKVLEGVSSVFIKIGSDQLTLLGASLLARGLVHPLSGLRYTVGSR
jgi:hypothetical protein